MIASIINPAEDKRWDKFVRAHKFGTIFHLADWSEVLRKTFSYEPVYIVLEENGNIRAGLPFMKIDSWLTGKRLISLPRTSYCDPLVETEEELAMILQTAGEMVDEQKMDFFEIKTQKNADLLSDSGIRYYDHFRNQILDLEAGPEKLWARFHRTCVRQRIMKAQKDQVTVRIGDTFRDLEIFYDLHKSTTKKHKVAPRPFSFFNNIRDTFGDKKKVKFLIAEKDGTVGAAALFLISGESIIFEFHGINYNLIEHSPGHLIVWEAIQMACKEGLKYFDFGLTPPDNIGLLNYKTRWGGSDAVLRYFYYPDVRGYKAFVKKTEAPEELNTSRLHLIKHKVKTFAAEKLYRHLG